jgi:hypothetical protein
LATRAGLPAACAVLSAALLATPADGETVEPLTESVAEPVKGGTVCREEPAKALPTPHVTPVGLPGRIAAAAGAGAVLVAALAAGARIFARGRSARRSGLRRDIPASAAQAGPSRGADGAAQGKRGSEP